LTINRKKTRIVNLYESGASLDFLGFTFRYDCALNGHNRKYLNGFPSRKSLASLVLQSCRRAARNLQHIRQ
jgi:RNA-directed DNA polymerase